MRALIVLLLAAMAAGAWNCPRCGLDVQGDLCRACGIPRVPPGMVYVPRTTVVIQGDTLSVAPFLVDTFPVTYRSVLPWLGENCRDPRALASVITGQYNENGLFLAFTPFVAGTGGEFTVPAPCMDRPAAGFTWNGATAYLAFRGLRLPTLGELYAAHQHGHVESFNVYTEMQNYADVLESSLGSILGNLALQAMYAGYSTAEERLMWELTFTPFGDPPVTAVPRVENPFITLFKALPAPRTTGTGRDMGYFNVIFRGALNLPEAQ